MPQLKAPPMKMGGALLSFLSKTGRIEDRRRPLPEDGHGLGFPGFSVERGQQAVESPFARSWFEADGEIGDEPPEICPVCKVPSMKIRKIEKEAV